MLHCSGMDIRIQAQPAWLNGRRTRQPPIQHPLSKGAFSTRYDYWVV